MATTNQVTMDPKEAQFLTRNRALSFKSAVWGSLGMATFFGALMTISAGLISIASGIPAITAGGMPTASAALLGGPIPLLVLGGLIAFGAFATYISQHYATEMRILQDEHMAEQQAKCMQQGTSQSVSVAHENPGRADGKTWREAVANDNQQQRSTAR